MKERAACLSAEECLVLTTLGGIPRPKRLHLAGGNDMPVVVSRILCWWCRDYHHPDEVEICMVLPRKTAAAANGQSSTSTALTAGLLSQYAELWAFLTSTSHPDGEKRRTGRISLSFEQGLLGLLLTDSETDAYAFLNGRSVDDLLLEAEARLSDGSLSWRPSRYGKGRK